MTETSPTNTTQATDDRNATDVVLVGHCVPDQFMLQNAVRRALPGAAIVSVNREMDLESYRHDRALWLVNRVLDGVFAGNSGIDLIRRTVGRSSGERSPRVMLVSDLPEAQAEAREAGALPGFGKRAVNAASTVSMLQEAAASRTG